MGGQLQRHGSENGDSPPAVEIRYLSVEMQNAMAHDVEDEAMSNRNDTLDNAAAQTVDLSATEYEEVDTETGEVKETGSEQAAPAPAPEY